VYGHPSHFFEKRKSSIANKNPQKMDGLY